MNKAVQFKQSQKTIYHASCRAEFLLFGFLVILKTGLSVLEAISLAHVAFNKKDQLDNQILQIKPWLSYQHILSANYIKYKLIQQQLKSSLNEFLLRMAHHFRLHLASVFVLVLLICPCLQTCHYSCSTCDGISYTSCQDCPNNATLQVVNRNTFQREVSLQPTGVCTDSIVRSVNGLGIALLVICLTLCFFLRSEEAFYLALAVQSMGLLGLVQVNWGFPTSFMLDSFQYLMIFSKIAQSFKESNEVLSSNNYYKADKLFHTAKLLPNIFLVGIVNCGVCVMMVALPIIKAVRKRWLGKSHSSISDSSLDKICSAMMVIFLMNIQEMMLLIYLAYKYGVMNAGQIIATVTYFVFVAYFFVSSVFRPFMFFRSKKVQALVIMRKVIQPFFIALQPENQIVLLVVIIMFDVAQILLTSKPRQLSGFNRLLAYRMCQLVAMLLLIIHYILQIKVNTEQAARILGIISVISLCAFIYPLTVELVRLCRLFVTTNIKDQQPEEQVDESKPKKVNTEITEFQINNSIVKEQTLTQNLKKRSAYIANETFQQLGQQNSVQNAVHAHRKNRKDDPFQEELEIVFGDQIIIDDTQNNQENQFQIIRNRPNSSSQQNQSAAKKHEPTKVIIQTWTRQLKVPSHSDSINKIEQKQLSEPPSQSKSSGRQPKLSKRRKRAQ